MWVIEVPQTAHGHIKHTHLHTNHTRSEHIHTLKQCHIYTWIHSHCTHKYDVPSTHTNALYLHTNTHTPHAQQFFLPSSLHFILRPKAFILRFPSTAIMMSQTSIKASSSHDLVRHLCRIAFCCFVSGFLLISVRSPSEMIFLYVSSCRTALASVHLMKLSRKMSSTSSAAQKEISRHINNRPITIKLTVRPPSTHC